MARASVIVGYFRRHVTIDGVRVGSFWGLRRAWRTQDAINDALAAARAGAREESYADGESVGYDKGRAECARNWLDGWRHGRALGRSERLFAQDGRTGRFVRVG